MNNDTGVRFLPTLEDQMMDDFINSQDSLWVRATDVNGKRGRMMRMPMRSPPPKDEEWECAPREVLNILVGAPADYQNQ
jgi:hypothetical protein